MKIINFLPIVAALLIFGVGFYNLLKIKLQVSSKGKVSELSELAAEGMQSFMKRIISSILQLLIYSAVLFIIFSYFFKSSFALNQIITFACGGLLMSISAFFIAKIVPFLIPKITQQSGSYLNEGITAMYTVSSAIAFILVGITILGLLGCIQFFGPVSSIGYGLGIIFASFFLRIAGGLFKAATDITADTVDQVEVEIPSFDRRNPATLLDLTGSYIGEIIGYTSDTLGSYIFAIISCILFSFSLYKAGFISELAQAKLLQLPIFIIAAALVVSIFVYFIFRIRLRFQRSNFLLEGVYLSLVLTGIATYFIIQILNIRLDILPLWGGSHFSLFAPYMVGLIGGVLIAFTSEYLTSYKYKPAKTIAENAEFGSVITLFNGFANSLKGLGLYMFFILLIAVLSFEFAGFLGLAMASLGMLSMISTILCLNLFKPLASNTQKIIKLAEVSSTVEKNAVEMDKIGQTTAALGNGFATGAATLSTFSLFFSIFLLLGQDVSSFMLLDKHLVIGLIIGFCIPLVFSGFLLKGLVFTIKRTITEVSRQFREIPYLLEDKARPDMTKAADLTAIDSVNSLSIPGVLMILPPVVAGAYSPQLLLGLVLGIFLSGISHAFYWGNMGDVFNNARHYIEQGYCGGKGTPTHKNSHLADNIGDAFKDLLSPSMSILIKSVCMIASLVIILML